MSNTFVPFNFAPKSHQILAIGGTTTYTIPSNEYAFVKVSSPVNSTASTVTLDGVTVFSTGSAFNDTAVFASDTAPSYTSSSKYLLRYSAYRTDTKAVLAVASGPTDGYLHNGQTVTFTNGGGPPSTIWVSAVTDPSCGEFEFWAKAGNVIAITGSEVYVTIHKYDVPS